MNRRKFLYAAGAGLAGIVLASATILLRHNTQEDGFYWCDGKVVDSYGTLKERRLRLLEYVENDKVIGHFGIVFDKNSKICSIDSRLEEEISPDEFPQILREQMPILMKHSRKHDFITHIEVSEIHYGGDYKGLKFSFPDGTYEVFTPPNERYIKTAGKIEREIKRESFFERLFYKLSHYLPFPNLDGWRPPLFF
ncbi:hypothetical protein HYV88_05015 [Candidatus Woesearchaeota archaeon]|nr:hypothetical protein [Candidatus Woesearchaeota archaeon]